MNEEGIEEEDIVINNYVPLTDGEELTTIHINFYGNKKGAERLKQQILQNIQIIKRIKAKLKECKENAGGMEFGLVLEKILEGKK